MVLLLGGGIIGLAGVSILNNFVTLIILVMTGRKFIGRIDSWAIDTGFLRKLIGESYPLLLNHFLATIFFQIDVIILEATWGAATVAQYSVAYRWILTIMIIPSYFTQALLPVMSRQYTENPEALRKTYAFGIKLMFALAVPAAAFFTFFAVPLVTLMGSAQYLPDGAIALQLMIWSIPIGWLNSLTQYALIAVDLQRRITWAFVVAVTFNIVSNSILIPRFGYPAAAVTTILSELVLLIPFALLMQRGLHQRLDWGGLLWRPAVAGSVLLIVTLAFTPALSYLALVIGLGVYALVMLALRPLDGPERELAGRFLPKPLARLLG
jgi:O-antigen/teichoic acid export membrane protein